MNNDKNETLRIKLGFIEKIVELLVPVVLIVALLKG
jgi:hypothetical protein